MTDVKTGLGLEFAKVVYAAIENICQYPLAWTRLSRNTRRCLLNRFPYGVVYQSKGDVIIIIAVHATQQETGLLAQEKSIGHT